MKKIITVISIASILVLGSCKKETNTSKQAPLLATTILGKWNYTAVTAVKKGDIISPRLQFTIPYPIYNFLANGTCATNVADILTYTVKNDTSISFSGNTIIPSHQYNVKITDNTMEWTGFAPFVPSIGDDIDHIVLDFERIP